MALEFVPVGSKPVKVALLMTVWLGRMKSSPVSIWNVVPLPGLLAVAIRPSTLPLLKTKVPATAGIVAVKNKTPQTADNKKVFFILDPHLKNYAEGGSSI